MPELRDGSTLTTPAGTPASARIAAIASAVSGVSLAGLRITVQPAASAGPILRVAIAAGKFHGVTSTQTPTGWRTTRIRLAPLGAVPTMPEPRTASSANQRKNSAAYVTSPLASVSALPFSRLISFARSSARADISSQARRRCSPRTRGAVAAQAGPASAAASTAAIASASPPLATEAITPPVAGSSTSKRSPDEAGTHLPPMNSSVSTPPAWSRSRGPATGSLPSAG